MSNNTTENLVIVILQPKVVSNNALEESLVNLLVRNQPDDLTKTFTDGQDASA